MKTYKLVIPVMEGMELDPKVKSENAHKAAEIIWKRISKLLSGHVPKFLFTLQEKGGDTSSFEVKEKLSNNTYTIKERSDIQIDKSDIKIFHDHIKQFKKEIKDDKQTGGKRRRRRSSSSSSDSDSDSVYSGVEFMTRSTSPLAMFHYTTKFYQQRDGSLIKHEPTTNPSVTIIDPIPVVPMWYSGPTYRHSFTSIPLFRPPLHPFINLWCCPSSRPTTTSTEYTDLSPPC